MPQQRGRSQLRGSLSVAVMLAPAFRWIAAEADSSSSRTPACELAIEAMPLMRCSRGPKGGPSASMCTSTRGHHVLPEDLEGRSVPSRHASRLIGASSTFRHRSTASDSSRVIAEVFPTEVQDVFAKYKEAFAGRAITSLTKVP